MAMNRVEYIRYVNNLLFGRFAQQDTAAWLQSHLNAERARLLKTLEARVQKEETPMNRSIFLIRVKAILMHPHDTKNHTGHCVGSFVRTYRVSNRLGFSDVNHPVDAERFIARAEALAAIDEAASSYVQFEVVEFKESP